MRSLPGVFPILFVMVASLLGGGCQSGPSSYEVQTKLRQELDAMPPRSPGIDAFNLLKREGFSPAYQEPKLIAGNNIRWWTNLLPTDWVNVWVTLDDAGRVSSTDVQMNQNFP